jgi:hypothetical protein
MGTGHLAQGNGFDVPVQTAAGRKSHDVSEVVA